MLTSYLTQIESYEEQKQLLFSKEKPGYHLRYQVWGKYPVPGMMTFNPSKQKEAWVILLLNHISLEYQIWSPFIFCYTFRLYRMYNDILKLALIKFIQTEALLIILLICYTNEYGSEVAMHIDLTILK